ncbi:MAG: LysM peptidoglycan-binding domain-containing protein [Cyanobacteria bacterium NC_groundwater_1444_Ag_S-0.65um_54_12]|nr:LysM peptidoglycan-binding domain-containing protein [Cyanobacteria bacterium NC_groundwater_1444_Ag_S-0.65um_54_12]
MFDDTASIGDELEQIANLLAQLKNVALPRSYTRVITESPWLSGQLPAAEAHDARNAWVPTVATSGLLVSLLLGAPGWSQAAAIFKPASSGLATWNVVIPPPPALPPAQLPLVAFAKPAAPYLASPLLLPDKVIAPPSLPPPVSRSPATLFPMPPAASNQIDLAMPAAGSGRDAHDPPAASNQIDLAMPAEGSGRDAHDPPAASNQIDLAMPAAGSGRDAHDPVNRPATETARSAAPDLTTTRTVPELPFAKPVSETLPQASGRKLAATNKLLLPPDRSGLAIARWRQQAITANGSKASKVASTGDNIARERLAAEVKPRVDLPFSGTAKLHRVRPGETLYSMARHYYRDGGAHWQLIFAANRDRITNPDKIFPDELLVIPSLTETLAEKVEKASAPKRAKRQAKLRHKTRLVQRSLPRWRPDLPI